MLRQLHIVGGTTDWGLAFHDFEIRHSPFLDSKVKHGSGCWTFFEKRFFVCKGCLGIASSDNCRLVCLDV